MVRLNRKVEYALIALQHMRSKSPGSLTTAKEISQIYSTPFDATSRVMQVLAQKEVLKSEQGAHGGYQLVRDLSRVNLFDLVETVLGPISVAKCLQHGDKDQGCEIKDNCNIVAPINLFNRRLSDFFKSVWLNELLDGRIPTTRLHVGKDPQGRAVVRAAQSAASEMVGLTAEES